MKALALVLVLLPSLSSCMPEVPPVALDPPPTPVLTSESIWGVSNKAYLKVLLQPEPSSEVTGFLRRGDLAEVISKIGDENGNDYWLEIRFSDTSETGWIRNADLDVYVTRHQARTASEALISD